MERYGTEYGGFFYPKQLAGLTSDSVLYCVGAGEDISHDICLAKQLGCNVHIFDPTPRAIDHVKYVQELFRGNASATPNVRFGGGDPKYLDMLMENKIDPDKIKLHTYGIYTENKIAKFYKPENEEHVSYSVVEGMKSNDYIEVEMKTLRRVMYENKHKHIDLLKIDIEGCECDVLEEMINQNIYPRYLSVDFDLAYHCPEKIRNPKRCQKTIQLLIRKGYRVLNMEGTDVSFINTKLFQI